ncbi:type VI secretion system contractile sheath domain-containing protein [Aquabacterium sp.]|uniref:type VI secretion system contractile sheath domain-containing protein n=1 Tax=Aquabacterium sp. TaxID=1872578 RepID=UPI0035B07D72
MTTPVNFGALQRPAPEWSADRPTRIAVLGAFRGHAAATQTLAQRKPVRVEFDSIDAAMARLQTSLTLPLGPGGSAVTLPLPSLAALHPDALYRALDVFSAVADLRRRLNDRSSFAAAAAELRKTAGIAPPPAVPSAAPAATAPSDDLARLLGQPIADMPKVHSGTAIEGLVQQVVAPYVLPAADPQQGALIAAVDAALSGLMRAVLHLPDFQELEALWRGLDFLLRRIETGPDLQVHLIDVSAAELATDLAGDDLSASGLYQQLVERPAQIGGDGGDGGYALVLAAFDFDATAEHAQLLGRLAQVAAHAGAPLVAGLGLNAAALFAQATPAVSADVAGAWQALRGLPAASGLGLVAPRFLLRLPYGPRSDAIESFTFDECPAGGKPEALTNALLWGHAAWLVAERLGSPAALEGDTPDLLVDDLPLHITRDADGEPQAVPCTEQLLTTDAATQLAQRGVMAAVARRGQTELRLAGLFAFNGVSLTLGAHGAIEAPAPRVAVQNKGFDVGFVFKP